MSSSLAPGMRRAGTPVAVLACARRLAHIPAMVARPLPWLLALVALVLVALTLGQHDGRPALGHQVRVGPCLPATADGCGSTERQTPSGCRVACAGMAVAMIGEGLQAFLGQARANRPASPVLALGRVIAPDPRPPQDSAAA